MQAPWAALDTFISGQIAGILEPSETTQAYLKSVPSKTAHIHWPKQAMVKSKANGAEKPL